MALLQSTLDLDGHIEGTLLLELMVLLQKLPDSCSVGAAGRDPNGWRSLFHLSQS